MTRGPEPPPEGPGTPAAKPRGGARSDLERIAEAYRRAGLEDRPETPAAVPPPAAPPRFRWGELEVYELLDSGSRGDVYRARDPRLDRWVALKLFRDSGDPAAVERFLSEARRLARLRHPNVVSVHGARVHDGRAGLWTDLLEGRNLESRLAEDGPFSPAEAAAIGLDLCRALAALHAEGLLHGDVKTANVVRDRGGRIVLVDLGSGRDLHRHAPGDPVSGTPLAAAPEVLGGHPPSAASDVYSLGALLFRLVTGEYPVPASDLDELLDRHARGDRSRLRELRPDLPSRFVAAVEAALEPDPARRTRSVADLEAGLLEGPAGGTRTAPRPLRLLVVLLALVGIAAAAAFLGGWPGRPSPVEVSATLYRARGAERAPLDGSGSVAPGDHLYLEVNAGEPLHAYVLNEDATGALHALFPVAGFDTGNPIPGSRPHRLPGSRDRVPQDWVVTEAGGAETVLLVFSRDPVAALEAEVASVSPVREEAGISYARLQPELLDGLRAIGGFAPAGDLPPEPGTRLLRLAESLTGSEEIWIRSYVLRNDGPAAP